jgi:hypothetical protein
MAGPYRAASLTTERRWKRPPGGRQKKKRAFRWNSSGSCTPTLTPPATPVTTPSRPFSSPDPLARLLPTTMPRKSASLPKKICRNRSCSTTQRYWLITLRAFEYFIIPVTVKVETPFIIQNEGSVITRPADSGIFCQNMEPIRNSRGDK